MNKANNNKIISSNPLFIAGGALPLGYPAYIVRKIENKIDNAIFNRHKNVYIRGPRQIGKTSLLFKLRERLKTTAWTCSFINLATMKKNLPEWFEQIGEIIFQDCQLEGKYIPLKNLNDLRSFLLKRLGVGNDINPIKLALFLDEIEGIFDVGHSNEFLMLLRDLFQQYRGQFIIIAAGSVKARNLIGDPRMSPFNVADEIGIGDFSEEECSQLTENLKNFMPSIENVVRESIYFWTSGHPYLTQKICEILEDRFISEKLSKVTKEDVDIIVNSELLLSEVDATDSHMLHVHKEMANLLPVQFDILKRILNGEKVYSTEKNSYSLYLTGIIKTLDGKPFQMRNQIYLELLKKYYLNKEFASRFFVRRRKFSWLHLTDLHLGMKDQDWRWPNLRERFFEDIKELYKRCGPWDLVFFTGDITQKGAAEEFNKADIILEQIWDQFKNLGFSPQLLVIPGNHDLVRPSDDLQPAVRLIVKYWNMDSAVRNEFWQNLNSEYRQVISDAFRNYSHWWQKKQYNDLDINYGILPGDFSATFEKNGRKIGIIGLNSSFLQLTGEDYEGKLVIHPLQFHAVCSEDGPEWAKQHDACILLTHHPPAWLDKESQKHFNSEIIDHGRFAIHLCGHMHETKFQEIAVGGNASNRLMQGRSFFGLEYYGEKVKRSHGYSVGKIEFSSERGQITIWPREARLGGGELNIVPDYSVKLTDNQHMTPVDFEL